MHTELNFNSRERKFHLRDIFSIETYSCGQSTCAEIYANFLSAGGTARPKGVSQNS